MSMVVVFVIVAKTGGSKSTRMTFRMIYNQKGWSGGFSQICGRKAVAQVASQYAYPPKTNITMEKQAFEDVSPIKNGDFRMSC